MFQEELKKGAAAMGFQLDEGQMGAFGRYMEFLLSYNEKVNLTAITEPDEIAYKHFVDSVAALSLFEVKEGASLIDVGTGAGFPGVPMKIVRPDLRLTLLDSLQKRIVFLQELSRMLGQENRTVHLRAEQAGIDPSLRERYDVATSRAVASLRVLAEYCLPLVKTGGVMLALKGPGCGEEVREAANALSILGGEMEQVISYELPGYGGRSLVVIRKRSQTPTKYPRQRVKLSEKPL